MASTADAAVSLLSAMRIVSRPVALVTSLAIPAATSTAACAMLVVF